MAQGTLHVYICVLLILTRFSCGSTVSVCSNSHAIGVSDRSIIPDSSMTASSYFNDIETWSSYRHAFAPYKGRLNNYNGWMPRHKKNPYDFLQIDFGAAYVICGVATQGAFFGWVKRYKLSFSTDNRRWKTYQVKHIDKLFIGNSNKNTAKKNMLSFPVKARYIRFIPRAYYNFKSLRVEVYISSKDIVPVITKAKALSSTSISMKWKIKSKHKVYDSINYTIMYMSQDRRKQSVDVGDATRYNLTDLQKYTKYNITVIAFMKNWKAGSTSAVRRVQTLDDVCSNSQAIGVSDRSIIPDSSMTASSYLNDKYPTSHLFNPLYKPSNGRLYGKDGWIPRTNNNPNDYLQIDLGKTHVICGVATQGGYGWVKQYKLRFSKDKSTWNTIQRGNKDKLFQGNTNENSVSKNKLSSPVKARYIRFLPTAYMYSRFKSMRVEVYVA